MNTTAAAHLVSVSLAATHGFSKTSLRLDVAIIVSATWMATAATIEMEVDK
jgi:hypothetical protein